MNTKKSNILVVDDEPDIVAVLGDFLASKGYKTIGAFNGAEALDILGRERLDLVLLDIMMPGINGIEVAKIIKERHPYIKLVILTGFPDTANELLKNEILEDVLIKPIKMQELLNRLLDILAKERPYSLNYKPQQVIKARLLTIKARLLFIESNHDIYNFLKQHFQSLSAKGEDYEIELADTEKQIYKMTKLFKPDMFLVNASIMRKSGKSMFLCTSEENLPHAEVIIYNAGGVEHIKNSEIDRITNAVKTTCLKYGFIDAKWVKL